MNDMKHVTETSVDVLVDLLVHDGVTVTLYLTHFYQKTLQRLYCDGSARLQYQPLSPRPLK
jgi:hypothetical protein